MKIVFDNLAFSIQKAGGVSAVWSALISGIPKKFILKYIDWNNENIFYDQTIMDSSKIVKRQSFYPKFQRLKTFKLNYSKKFIFHSSVYRICDNVNAKNVITVHDFIDIKFNKNILLRSLRWFFMKKSIVNSDAIICVSHNTKNDLLKYLPKVDRTKINVVHNGVSDCFHQIDSSYSDENFLLYVGGRQSYKNFHILIKVLEKLNGYTLKFIGGGKLTNKEKLLLDKSLHNRYTHIQSINNYDLNLLYNKAFCLVYPSIYEGFGLPLIEAQSSGCPVIATKISSFPEIVGNSAILLNNMNTDNIISAVKVLENPANRNKYVRLGLKNSKRFSYDLMTKKYLDIYKKVWSGI